MRLLVLAALAAVALADVSHLIDTQYGPPASSYGAPQSSVTEKHFNAVTPPTFGLHLPIFEHREFNPQIGLSNPGFIFSSTPAPIINTDFSFSTTPAPIIDAGIGVSTTPAPFVESTVVSSTPAPAIQVKSGSLGTGYSYTTPVPDLSVNVGNVGLQNSGFISSTPTPSVSVTSGSQENLNLDYKPGFNLFSTPAPSIFSTAAPSIFSTSAPSISSGFNFGPANFPGFNLGYNYGLGGFSTPAPITFGSGGLTSLDSNLFNADAALNSGSVHGITSGGSLNDAFGISTSGISYQRQPAQVQKHVYFFAAPEEPDLPRPRINVIPPGPAKKNVKIIFIKSPSAPPPAPIRIAAPPQDEEKTVVYVLVKRPEEQQDIELQTPPPTPPSKPEVYFIKYKTQQEAEHAISQVQSGHSSSEQHVVADTVSNGDLVNTISKESLVTPEPIVNYVTSTTPAPVGIISTENSIAAQPLFNYVSSTTPSPIFNFIGGQSGGIYGPGFASNFNLSPQLDDSDISQNLISSSLFSTASPVVVSTGESGLVGSTTPVPLGPHLTYGPPDFKK